MIKPSIIRSHILLAIPALAGAMVTASCSTRGEKVAIVPPAADFAANCTVEGVSRLIAGIGHGITIKQVPNGPQLPGGVRFVKARGALPAFCQVTGSYVTNPETGKTAHFLATLPERWNGKFLQLGCSGGCGFLLMNDPAAPPITITAQGYPGQLIEKGYATFGNDLGRIAPNPMAPLEWTLRADGTPDPDAVEDYLYRADMVMADMGKAFTRAFYSGLKGKPAQISWSYFSGCSQGGREALVAATRFPDKFDGIIAGSPVSSQPGVILHGLGLALRAQRGDLTRLTPGQVKFINDRVNAQCDGLDGVVDGLIQNPAACNIHPVRDLPLCQPGHSGDDCLTASQREAVSAWLSGMTDQAGNLLQPGFSISEAGYGGIAPMPAAAPVDGHVRASIGKGFDGMTLATVRDGGPGEIDAYRVIVNRKVFDSYMALVRKGTVMAEDFGALMRSKTKLLWYHNLSDEALTPYMSINLYKQLAELHGGYGRVQERARLFAIPNSGHCGMSGSGPSNFDAIGALETWVEQGKAPDAIPARLLDPASDNLIMGKVDWSKPPIRSMPLCPFPQMARYKGSGDVKLAANWECRATDTRMLGVGESGRQAGVRR
ncbi:MAG: tannase/feruloyl esterase family alpha/beta hydrolase [Novosphingobium sp.]|nr:tannase/feruloyl esterase family alpha/beta hydrolase [Novosphingobium sp.]